MQLSDTADLVTGAAIVSGAGVLMCAAIQRVGPLHLLSRGLDHLRALCYMLQDMAVVAWRRRERYQEHLRRARIER